LVRAAVGDDGWVTAGTLPPMELTTALLCDFAQVREGLLFVASGGVTRCYRAELPAPLGICWAGVLEMDEREAARPHEVAVVVVDEDGGTLAELSMSGRLEGAQLMVGERLNLPLVVDLRGVEVTRYGPLEVRVYVNGELRRSLGVRVVEVPAPEPEAAA
jgi:hypothetical protein